jgi:hypothetical protein
VAEKRPEEALPITLILVIDRSASMAGEKLELAVEGARRAAARLDAFDRVGVVTFADDVTLDVAPQSPAELGNLGFRLIGLRAGGRTDIHAALRALVPIFAAERSPIRHALLLTDGEQSVGMPIFGPVVQVLTRSGVTLTAVGLGAGHDERLLKQIVQFSRGLYVPVDTAAELPTILTRDTTRIAEERSQRARAAAPRVGDDRPAEPRPPDPEPDSEPEPEASPAPPDPEPAPPPPPRAERLPLRRVRPHEATAGLDDAALPSVEPPRASKAAPDAVVLLVRGDEPVLAARRTGLGRALAWLLPPDDAGARAWGDLGRVLVQGVRAVLAPEGSLPGGTPARVLAGPDGARLRVDALLGPEDAVRGEWRGTLPDGTAATRPLGPFGDGREEPLPDGAPGTVATVVLADAATGAAFPPLTYLVPGGAEPERPGDAAALERTLGRPAADPARVAAAVEAAPSPQRTPLWPWFVLAAVLLLPFDVAAHRRSLAP